VAFAGTAAAFAFDGLTFLFSALFLLGLRLPASSVDTKAETSKPRGVRATVSEMREGIRYVAGSTILWLSIALAALTSIGEPEPCKSPCPNSSTMSMGRTSGCWESSGRLEALAQSLRFPSFPFSAA